MAILISRSVHDLRKRASRANRPGLTGLTSPVTVYPTNAPWRNESTYVFSISKPVTMSDTTPMYDFRLSSPSEMMSSPAASCTAAT